jgi:hypothetical protein
VCFGFQTLRLLVLDGVNVHREAIDSLRRGRKDVPTFFLFDECQKIVLAFDLKLQFIYPFAVPLGLKASG